MMEFKVYDGQQEHVVVPKVLMYDHIVKRSEQVHVQ